MWLRKAADQENASAMYSLGRSYEHGTGGIIQDFVQAIIWYSKAAEQGFELAIQRLEDLENR